MRKVKNLPNNSDTKDILKELEAIVSRGYSSWNVFEDWLSLMFYALQQNDSEYLSVVKKYRNIGSMGTREIDHFCNAFALLMLKMKEINRELLGALYMQWEVSSKYAGQFFTPWPIAQFMAQVLGTEGEKIYDPACGSGIMLIAHAKTLTNEQLDTKLFVGQDIDFTCIMMCAMNLTFFNLNGTVIWGDSLANTQRRVFRTVRSYLGGSLQELPLEAQTKAA